MFILQYKSEKIVIMQNFVEIIMLIIILYVTFACRTDLDTSLITRAVVIVLYFSINWIFFLLSLPKVFKSILYIRIYILIRCKFLKENGAYLQYTLWLKLICVLSSSILRIIFKHPIHSKTMRIKQNSTLFHFHRH